jgi:threonyl-tRNA synthetase
VIVGERERDTQTVAVRARKAGDLGSMGTDEFVAALQQERDTRGATMLTIETDAS